MPFYVLHPREIERIRHEKNAVIVDVREQEEYLRFHYKNAVNMPYCDSESWFNRFHVGQTYILYCAYGNVSLLAARTLAKRGITAYTVVGGAKELRHYT